MSGLMKVTPRKPRVALPSRWQLLDLAVWNSSSIREPSWLPMLAFGQRVPALVGAVVGVGLHDFAHRQVAALLMLDAFTEEVAQAVALGQQRVHHAGLAGGEPDVAGFLDVLEKHPQPFQRPVEDSRAFLADEQFAEVRESSPSAAATRSGRSACAVATRRHRPGASP